MGSNINSNNLFNRFLTNSPSQPIQVNVPNNTQPLKPFGGLTQDTFVSGTDQTNQIKFVQASDGQFYTIPADSNLVYDKENKQFYLEKTDELGNKTREAISLPAGSTLNFPYLGQVDQTSMPRQTVNQQMPQITDQSGNKIEIGPNDKLFFDQNTGQYYLQKANGQTEDITNKDGHLTIPQGPTYNEPIIQEAALNISGKGQIWDALGLPEGLYTGPVDVNSMVPNLGDQTGITVQAGMLASAGLYTQLQRTLSIINYLNTAPNGTQPNPNFSYLAGRPPYGQDSPEGQREQAKVFAQIRTTIIAQLVRIADQLKAANNGLKQQTDLASNQLKAQNTEVKKWVDSTGGGGGGG